MDVPDHVNESIEAIAELVQRGERHMTVHQRGIERLTSAVARPQFLYLIIVIALSWIGFNESLRALGARPVDPAPFCYLQCLVTLAALVIATMVLITQNRHLAQSEKRGHLDLQINLLTERKITKVIALLEELRRDLPNVRNRADPEATAMAVRADPLAVADALQAIEDEAEDREDTPTPTFTPVPFIAGPDSEDPSES
jgi:uncharacterized membrane protein